MKRLAASATKTPTTRTFDKRRSWYITQKAGGDDGPEVQLRHLQLRFYWRKHCRIVFTGCRKTLLDTKNENAYFDALTYFKTKKEFNEAIMAGWCSTEISEG